MNTPLRALALVSFLLSLAGSGRGATPDWPQWRGPARDGHAAPGVAIPTRLPATPKIVWRVNVGGGFSSPVVVEDSLVYLDENGQQEVAHRLDPKTGREFWQVPFAARTEDEWGAGPRSTPILDGARAYVQSCNGEFRCLNLADGHVRWGVSFEKDFGVKFLGSKSNEGVASRRGNNGSGLVDGPDVIVPVGSTNSACLVCFNKKTGAVRWKSQSDEMAYSSLMVAPLAGVPQVVAFSADALLGVDRADGRLLWRVPLRTNAKRHAASPVIWGDVVAVNSHTIGLVALRIARAGDGFTATELWANRDLKINLATPVLVGEHLFSHGPAKNFVCVDAATGKQLWAQDGFGKDYSSTLALGKNLLVLTDLGELVLVAADAGKYQELGRQQVCGKNWSFPAYADGKLFVRDARELQCLDLLNAN